MLHIIRKYHCSKQEEVGYPCRLDTPTPGSDTRTEIKAYPEKSPRLLYILDRAEPLPFLVSPTVKNITVTGHGKTRIAAKQLAQMVKRFSILAESYNTPAIEIVKQLGAVETEFCQQRFICHTAELSANSCPIPEISIRHPHPGQDDEGFAMLYNRVLGFLGTPIAKAFLSQIAVRPSFDREGYFLAEVEGQPAGFLSIEIEPWGVPGSQFAYIFQIGVESVWRGTGLAETLMAHAREFAVKRGIKRIGVSARKSNRFAVAFFVKHGFKLAFEVTGYLVE